jgi:hypothetical protein
VATAYDLIFQAEPAPGAHAWGRRIFIVGASGSGKSYFAEGLTVEAIRRGVARVAYVHDQKDPTPQYGGTVRPTLEALDANPPAPGDSPIIVFNDRIARQAADPIASRAIRDSRDRGIATWVLIDEGAKAIAGRQRWDGEALGVIEREGRGWGASIVVGTQIPQNMPAEVVDLASAMVIMRLDARSLNYVIDLFRLPASTIDVIAKLQLGEFLLYRAGDPQVSTTIYGPA